MLASVPKNFLVVAIDGSLPFRVARDGKEIFKYFDETAHELHPCVLQYHQKFSPIIYVRWLVDPRGCSPTPNEFKAVVAELRNHVSGDPRHFDDAAKIEQTKDRGADRDDIEKGRHAFLKGKQLRMCNASAHVGRVIDVGPTILQILTWYCATEFIIADSPQDQPKKCLQDPVSYCEHTAVTKTDTTLCARYRQHQHDGSLARGRLPGALPAEVIQV
jgi:hypothetical protein